MYIDIVDEQPRTVVAFKFKGPLPGFRDADEPEFHQSKKETENTQIEAGTLQIGQHSQILTRCWRTHHQCSGN